MRHSSSECRWSLEWFVESTTFWSILDFLTALFKFSYGDHTLSSFPFLKLCNSLPTLRGLPALTRMLLNQGLKLQEEYQFYSHQTFTGLMLNASHCSGSHSSHFQPVSSLHMVEDVFMPHTCHTHKCTHSYSQFGGKGGVKVQITGLLLGSQDLYLWCICDKSLRIP